MLKVTLIDVPPEERKADIDRGYHAMATASRGVLIATLESMAGTIVNLVSAAPLSEDGNELARMALIADFIADNREYGEQTQRLLDALEKAPPTRSLN